MYLGESRRGGGLRGNQGAMRGHELCSGGSGEPLGDSALERNVV